MFNNITTKEKFQILQAVQQSISTVIEQPNITQEPHLVAALCYEIPKQINALSFSGGYDLKVGSVFVHQRPRVKVTNFPEQKPASVEIGDLLLISTILDKKTNSKKQ